MHKAVKEKGLVTSLVMFKVRDGHVSRRSKASQAWLSKASYRCSVANSVGAYNLHLVEVLHSS
jgi:hypothetical protein